LFVFFNQKVVGACFTRPNEWEARERLPGGQICPCVVSLDAQSCPLPHGAARDDISWLDCRR